MTTLDKVEPNTIIRNENYETDLKYDLELNRMLLKVIGLWPTDSRRSTSFDRIIAALARFLTIFFSLFLMIPIGCHVLFVEKDWSASIQVLVTFNSCFEAMIKNAMVIARNEEIKRCIDMIATDWREVEWTECRSIMLENARTCRIFTIFYFTATIGCMSMYHFVVPFVFVSPDKFQRNRTYLAPLIYNAEFFVFDPRVSPMSEVVYLGQTLGAMATCTVNSAACSLTVKFALHALSLYQIVAVSIQSVDDDCDAKYHDDKQRRFAYIIRRHLHAIEFVPRIESALNEICFVCLVISTVNMCFIGFTLILEWENTAAGGIVSYAMAMISASSNMFVLCYSGDKLADKSRAVGLATYMTNWSRMPPNESRDLIMIIAASQLPIKFTAGHFFDLSLKTFFSVMKIAMSYLNFLRTTIQLYE